MISRKTEGSFCVCGFVKKDYVLSKTPLVGPSHHPTLEAST